jgi:5'(3')-deoxyribonucleotidase
LEGSRDAIDDYQANMKDDRSDRVQNVEDMERKLCDEHEGAEDGDD